MATSAIDSLQTAVEEQDAASRHLVPTDFSCEVCGESAQFVSSRTQPKCGPLVLDDHTTHVSDGQAYYHE